MVADSSYFLLSPYLPGLFVFGEFAELGALVSLGTKTHVEMAKLVTGLGFNPSSL